MLKNFTLLYVEDDNETVKGIKALLSDRVKELHIAYDGEEGLTKYKEIKPDIVLTDINMPKLSGLEMAKEMKEINNTQAILVLTAFDDSGFLHQCVDLGIDGYINKPIYDLNALLDPLNKTADRLQAYIDQKNLEHLLEVQGKTTAVGEMLENIAHQWRQPLTIVSTATSGLRMDIDLGEEITNEKIIECSQIVEKHATYLSNTIDDFRSFLQADTTNFSEINLKDVLNDAYNLVEATVAANKINCIHELHNVQLNGNKNQLIQTLLNICNNAKNALLTKDENERYVFLTTETKDNNAVIMIRDSGGGIQEDVMDRIFEPYFTTKHQSIGTGIGLYITFKTITKVYGGTIDARNVEYQYDGKDLKGAQFTITLPLNSV